MLASHRPDDVAATFTLRLTAVMLVTANEGQTMKSLPKRTLLIVMLLWMSMRPA